MNDKIGPIEVRYGITELLAIMKGIENIIPIIPRINAVTNINVAFPFVIPSLLFKHSTIPISSITHVYINRANRK